MHNMIESPTALIVVTEAAAREGWRIIASIELPLAEGCDQSGVMAFDRGHGIEGCHYAAIRWSREPSSAVRFYWGSYDLTREEAIAHMVAVAEQYA